MRRCFTPLLALLAIIVSGCSASAVPLAADTSSDEVDAEPTTVPAPPPGRVALAAVQGEPHVLWFWGAH